MTFKPMTYLASFALFVILALGLGGVVGYRRISDHLLAQSFLEAVAFDVRVEEGGRALRWEGDAPLGNGAFARIVGGAPSIEVRYPGGAVDTIPLGPRERVEDLRLGRGGRYLYARVHAASDLKALESTWICQYDLERRRLLRRRAINPFTLPVPFRPEQLR